MAETSFDAVAGTLNSKIRSYTNSYTFDSSGRCNTGISVTGTPAVAISRIISNVSAVTFAYYIDNGVLWLTGYALAFSGAYVGTTDLSIIIIDLTQ